MDTGSFNLYQAKLESTPYGELFQKLIRKDGFAANIIENYNNEIYVKVPQIILGTSIPTQKGVVKFENVRFGYPIVDEMGQTKPLLPKISRDKTIPYYGTLEMDAVHYKQITTIDGQPVYSQTPDERIHIPAEKCIPVMLGSTYCWLANKTPAQRMEMGECFNDILGYFINKSERTIISQEKLRFSTFITYVPDTSKETIEGRITCPTPQGTVVTIITITKQLVFTVILQHLKKGQSTKDIGYLPIFVIFKILGMDVDDATELILSFIEKEHREAAEYILEPSKSNYINYIGGDDSLDSLVTNVYIRRLKIDKSKVKRENVIKDIERDLFANVKTVENKLTHLAMYTARMVEVLIGENVRKMDDRDSWANKRISTPGRYVYQLFKGVWVKIINKVLLKSQEIKNLKDIVNKISLNEIRENFIRVFGSAGWGVKGSFNLENIVDSLKRETPIGVYSQIGRINTRTSKQSRNAAIRMPHPSQLGYICLYETPEGESCGLVKNLSASCYISLEQDPEPILAILRSEHLKGYFFEKRVSKDLKPLTLNGVIEGWCKPEDTVYILKYYKSLGYIYKDATIFYNPRDRVVEVFCDGERPLRPLLTVDLDGQLMIDKKNMWNADIDELIKNGCFEYIDCREQEWIYLADTVNTARERYNNIQKYLKISELKNPTQAQIEELEFLELKIGNVKYSYTHAEVDPTAMFGIAANLVPQANRQAGPRTSFQSTMSRQALTQYHSNEFLRFDTSYKMLQYPCKPIFQNDLQDTAGLNLMPNGQMLQVAILAHPDNPEDGIVFKEEAIKYNNKLDFCKKMTSTVVVDENKNEYEERFARPPIMPNEPASRYDAIDENGIPILDAEIKPLDCIVGKIRIYNKNSSTHKAGTIENLSLYAGIGEGGFIDRVLITKNSLSEKVVKVKIRQNRKYSPGDKLASRYSQKGTVAKIVPARDLPRVSSGPLKGMVPDIFINPHGQPSRMTMNKMIEILVNKAAIIEGRYINSTTFRDFNEEIERAQKVLEDYGLDPNGKEEFELPNGRKLKTRVYFGPCFYQALKHHVADKISMRARSTVKPSTRQPVQGRSLEGGLRVGEMERDALISHGSSALLRERLCDVSDVYELPICGTCGTIAITNHYKKENKCNLCGDKAKIGMIRIPYVVKLLLFYLNAAGIHMTFKVNEIVSSNSKFGEKYLM